MKTMNLSVLLDGKWRSVDIFTDKHILLVGVPGAFTPGCESQLPSFMKAYNEFKQKGFDEVYCLSTNDPWVMRAWAKHMGVGDGVKVVSDGNGAFSDSNELLSDFSGLELGVRSKSYAMIIRNGTILHTGYDKEAYAEPVLKHLSRSHI